MEPFPRPQDYLSDHLRGEEPPERVLAELPGGAGAVPRARLGELLRPLGIVTHERPLDETAGALYDEELAMMAGAVGTRRREFAAGRCSARKALAELGITDFPLLAGPDRAPIWPGAVVGSITHTETSGGGYCGVAVAHRRLVASLGIDAEPRQPLPADLWSRVLDAREKHAALAASEPGVWARLVFSAKESVYKALFPLYGRFLDFSDVHVHLLPSQGRFVAELVGNAPAIAPAVPVLGRFVVDHELLLTTVLLPARGSPLAQEGLSLSHVPC